MSLKQCRGESYDYDANGNRKLKSSTWSGITDQVSTFNIADQQQTDGSTQFEYDANGRLSKKLTPIDNGTAIEEYSYSSQGRLHSVVFKQLDTTSSIETTIKTITYKHNALGNRVTKSVDGEVTEKYLWLNKTTLLATYDQNNNLKQRFEYGISHTPVKFTQNNNTYYITSDHLGSPRTITDESGTVIKAIEYDSFGNAVSDSNESFEIPFGFAGGLQDTDTHLLRFGYRDYDSSIGRWTARDPIGFAGGDTNLYGYVASDPVNLFDPTGLAPPLGGDMIVTSPYGPRNTGIKDASTDHKGVDLRAPENSPFFSTDKGVVVQSGNADGGSRVIIRNADGSYSWYRHIDPSVKRGDKIGEGESIGKTCIGLSCGTMEPHLHYERAEAGSASKSDPTKYLRDQYNKRKKGC